MEETIKIKENHIKNLEFQNLKMTKEINFLKNSKMHSLENREYLEYIENLTTELTKIINDNTIKSNEIEMWKKKCFNLDNAYNDLIFQMKKFFFFNSLIIF